MYSKFWFTGNVLRIMTSKITRVLFKSPIVISRWFYSKRSSLIGSIIIFLVDYTQNKRINMVFIFSLLSVTVSQKLRFQVEKKLNLLLWLSVSIIWNRHCGQMTYHVTISWARFEIHLPLLFSTKWKRESVNRDFVQLGQSLNSYQTGRWPWRDTCR